MFIWDFMTRSKKKASELTDKEVLRRLFPKEVRRELKKQDPKKIAPLFEKPKKRKRKR